MHLGTGGGVLHLVLHALERTGVLPNTGGEAALEPRSSGYKCSKCLYSSSLCQASPPNPPAGSPLPTSVSPGFAAYACLKVIRLPQPPKP